MEMKFDLNYNKIWWTFSFFIIIIIIIIYFFFALNFFKNCYVLRYCEAISHTRVSSDFLEQLEVGLKKIGCPSFFQSTSRSLKIG